MIVERERERESQRLPAIDQLIQDGVIQAIQRNGKGTLYRVFPYVTGVGLQTKYRWYWKG